MEDYCGRQMAEDRSILSESSEVERLLNPHQDNRIGDPDPANIDRRHGLSRRHTATNLLTRFQRLLSTNEPMTRRRRISGHRSVTNGMWERLFSVIIVIGLLIALSINLQFARRPSEYDERGLVFNFDTNVSAIADIEIWNTEYSIDDSFRVETHSHSTKSDGQMTPKQLVQWAKAYGFHALFLSDHNNLDGYAAAQREAEKHKIVIIPAMEYTCCRIHMNLVNITNTTTLQPVTWPTDKELQRVIKETHRQGGYVVVNHLPWSLDIEYNYQQPTLPRHPSIEDLLNWGVDGFESVHDNVIDLRMLRLSERTKRVIIASNDIHVASQPAFVWTTLSRSRLESASHSPQNITKDDILRELFIEKRSTFLYSATGASGRAYPRLRSGLFQYHWFAPLTTIQFGWLFTERKGMYSFTGEFCHERQFELHVKRIVWFIFWCVLGFIAFEVTRAMIVWLIRRMRNYTQGRIGERYRMI